MCLFIHSTSKQCQLHSRLHEGPGGLETDLTQVLGLGKVGQGDRTVAVKSLPAGGGASEAPRVGKGAECRRGSKRRWQVGCVLHRLDPPQCGLTRGPRLAQSPTMHVKPRLPPPGQGPEQRANPSSPTPFLESQISAGSSRALPRRREARGSGSAVHLPAQGSHQAPHPLQCPQLTFPTSDEGLNSMIAEAPAGFEPYELTSEPQGPPGSLSTSPTSLSSADPVHRRS